MAHRAAGFALAAGAQNLFNVFPDRNTTVNSFNGIQTFPSQSPFGMNGRTIYARIGRTFCSSARLVS
jgi:iron complex outermembrane receptor protein